MKVETPEIAWHCDHDSTTSIDFHPFLNILAVAGSDSSNSDVYLRIWEQDIPQLVKGYEKEGNNDRRIDSLMLRTFKLLFEIEKGHSSAINIVRFAPNGKFLCTGGDDAKVIIWEQKYRNKEFGSNERVLGWGESKVLLAHGKEVYDLEWSSDGQWVYSASQDNSVIVWNVEKGNT